MKKNLVITLADSAELLLTLKIYSGLKYAYRNASWCLVTWSEYKELVASVGHVDEVVYIDRAVVKRVLASPVFSNSYALNNLWDDVGEVIKTQFHWVINCTNNQISGYFSSMLNKEHMSGLYFNDRGQVAFNDIWSKYANEVFTIQPQCFNRYDLLLCMCGLQTEEMPVLNIDDRAKSSVAEKFTALRQKLGEKNQAKKLVGVDVGAFAGDAFDISEMTFNLLGSKDYYPVFLVKKGNQTQQTLIKEVSSSIETFITTVEYSWSDAQSVLLNIDAMITRAGAMKQLAHITETPTLAIKNQLVSNTGYSYFANDIILSTEGGDISAEAILVGLDMLLFGKIKKSASLPKEDVYQVVKDEWGTFMLRLNSPQGNATNISTYLMRLFMLELESGKPLQLNKLWVMGLFEKEEILEVVNNENAKIDHAISIILSMIRSSSEIATDSAQSKKFFLNLDVLINNNSINGLGEMVRSLFRPNILSISMEGKEGIRELEVILLEMKNSLIAAQRLLRKIASMYGQSSAQANVSGYFHEES